MVPQHGNADRSKPIAYGLPPIKERRVRIENESDRSPRTELNADLHSFKQLPYATGLVKLGKLWSPWLWIIVNTVMTEKVNYRVLVVRSFDVHP